ncbi:hypothetical protein D3C86_1399010 [compost metagenome]
MVGRHRRVEFVDHVGERRIGVERQVARPRRFARCRKRHQCRRQSAFLEAEAEHPVQPLVRHEDETAGRVEGIEVRLCLLLLHPVRPHRAFQRQELRQFTQGAIGVHGQHCQAGANVVGHQHEAAGRVQCQVHRVLALRALAVDEAQEAGAPVDPEGADFALVAMHGVEELARGVQRKKGRVDEVSSDVDQLQRSMRGVDLEDADAVAPRIALPGGSAADVGVHGGSLGGRRKAAGLH